MSRQSSDTRTRILDATWELLEQAPGKDISMSAIAKAAGISRQAVYLHFASRTELMIATTEYVDEVKGLYQRMEKIDAAADGSGMLQACVEVWGNYIPEIHAIAKALMRVKDTDADAATAWSRGMDCLREVNARIIDTLDQEGKLAGSLQTDTATDLLTAMLSIEQWELLTGEYGWSTRQYVDEMKELLSRCLVA